MNKDIQTEEWKQVKDVDPFYEVSSLGRVRSFRYDDPRILTPKFDKRGYLKIHLRNNGGIKSILLHRLVAFHFLPNPKELEVVNHKNGIKYDNRLENLEWMTNAENVWHAHRNGLWPHVPNPNYNRVGLVINTKTGVFYTTAKEAAIAHGIKVDALRRYLTGSRGNKTDLEYVRNYEARISA
jgi:hypothetical protein